MTQQIIEEAIRNRRVLMFTYEYSLRTVEPYLIGLSNTGFVSLRGFQTAGGSGHNWRLYHVEKMHDISVTGQFFLGNRLHYNPFDSAMSHIFERI